MPARYAAKRIIPSRKTTAPSWAQARLTWSSDTPIAPPTAASAQSRTTARRSESPMATRRCDEWSRPPSDARRPETQRDRVTSVVSKIGSAERAPVRRRWTSHRIGRAPLARHSAKQRRSPLGDGLRIDAVALAQHLDRSFRSVYCCSNGVTGRGASVKYLSHSASLVMARALMPSPPHRGTKHPRSPPTPVPTTGSCAPRR